MNREIKFRAKRGDNGKWVYGSLVNTIYYEGYMYIIPEQIGNNGEHIVSFEKVTIPVLPETIGQYIGLKDKSGHEIFEGDILLDRYEDEREENGFVKIFYPVVYKDGCFGWIGENCGQLYSFLDYPIPETIIVGNIYDNPEIINPL